MAMFSAFSGKYLTHPNEKTWLNSPWRIQRLYTTALKDSFGKLPAFFFLITEIKIKHYQFAQLLGSISSVSQQQCYWHFRWAILCFRLLSLVPDHQMPMVHLFPSPTVTMTTKNAPILFQIFCGNMVPLPLRITDEFSRYPPFIKWLPHNELWH